MRATRTVGMLFLLLYCMGSVLAQSFTYQGMLKTAGVPANGNYDFQFSLWTANSGGSQVGSTITRIGVSVSNGLFTTELDFGNVWDGNDRYLQIAVRPGDSTISYTTLSPRVKITATPYAAYALRPWQTVGSNIFYNAGYVGIGTNAPAAYLSLGGSDANTKLALWQGTAPGAMMGFGIAPNQFRLHLHNPANRFSFLDAPNGSELLTIQGTGRVGIGTNAPESLLHVFAGSAGTVTAVPNSVLTIEHSAHAYLSLLTPDNTERGILFGQPSSNVAGGIIYNNSATPNGLQFRTNGNATRMVIDGSGSVGIGTSSPSYPLHVQTNAGDRAIYGLHTAASGYNAGVYGVSASTSGAGVAGIASATSGYSSGVFGESASTNGRGVVGHATADSGETYGGYFRSASTNGRGVVGHATAGSGFAVGVWGRSDSPGGRGVIGEAAATSGEPVGVWGQSNSPDGKGVLGWVTATSGENYGGYFRTDSYQGRGVIGWASSGAGSPVGVFGQSNSATGFGVYCLGNFAVAGAKAFQIDHPLHPDTQYLNHFCTEGPEPINAYSGNITTDAQGYAVVQLPDYFESINRDFRYQLTVIDSSDDFVLAKVVREIQNNRFVIRTSKPFVKVSWEVKAVRNDRWVQEYGYQTEQPKPAEYRGKYLHPELFGQPKETGIYYHPVREREVTPNEPVRR